MDVSSVRHVMATAGLPTWHKHIMVVVDSKAREVARGHCDTTRHSHMQAKCSYDVLCQWNMIPDHLPSKDTGLNTISVVKRKRDRIPCRRM